MIKLGEVVMILDLHRQGLTVSAIARELGVDRKTAAALTSAAQRFSEQRSVSIRRRMESGTE